MADLSKFWRNQKAIASAEYDQKAMMAREMIVENFPDEGDEEKLRGVINHFANDQRAAMSIMGVLAQVGLMAMAMEDCTPSETTEDAPAPPLPWSERAKELEATEGHYADYAAWREWLAKEWAETVDGTDHLPILETLDNEGWTVAVMLYSIFCDFWRMRPWP